MMKSHIPKRKTVITNPRKCKHFKKLIGTMMKSHIPKQKANITKHRKYKHLRKTYRYDDEVTHPETENKHY